MNLRRALLPLTALAALAGAVLGMPTSGATFVQTSTYGVTATAAGDWTPPTVSVDDPGPAIGGTATVANHSAHTLAITVAARPWRQSHTGVTVPNRRSTLRCTR